MKLLRDAGFGSATWQTLARAADGGRTAGHAACSPCLCCGSCGSPPRDPIGGAWRMLLP